MDDSQRASPDAKNLADPGDRAPAELSTSEAESRSTLVVAPNEGPYVKFDHVNKSFDRPVLVDCSFEVYPGEGLAILGTRGSGKSLLLRLLMGFDQADSGTIWVAGMRLETDPDVLQRIRREIAVISQSGMVLEALTLDENVRGALEMRGDLESHQIGQISIGLLELGLLGDMGILTPAELPLDKRRLLALTAALATQPSAVVLDEPTEQASPTVSRGLIALLSRLKEQLHLTLVVSTNDLYLTRKLADKVLFLDRGKVVFWGSAAELFASQEKSVERYLRMEGMY